jgi:hypothetical protein
MLYWGTNEEQKVRQEELLMRPTIRIRCVLFFLLMMVRTTSVQAMTVVEQTFPDLVHRAEVIAVGTVTGIQEQWDSTRQAPFTTVTFSNLTVLKGEIPEATLTLELLGGHKPDGTVLSVIGSPRFTMGEKTLVFCNGNHRDIVPLVGIWQGRVRISFDLQRGVETVSDNFHAPIVAIQNGLVIKGSAIEQQHEALPLADFMTLIQQELENPYAPQ